MFLPWFTGCEYSGSPRRSTPALTATNAGAIKTNGRLFLLFMPRSAATRAPRQDNRRQAILDACAGLFSRRGYHATSLRHIAKSAGMLPGSVYYHFASKDDLLLEVYAMGVARIAARVDAAVETKRSPRARLEAACVAHLETLLERSDYAQVVVRVLPGDAAAVATRLAGMRNDYERRFRQLIDGLSLPRNVDRKLLRLGLLGALNSAQIWYRPNGDSPKTIARRYLDMLVPPKGYGK